MRVFLSYRRTDGGYAGRLHDALVVALGATNVFQDVAAITPGADFTVAVDDALDRCDAVIGLIGPTWGAATSADGVARLWQDDDFVRFELARALTRGVPVIPVLVGGARLPAPSDLPADVQPLAHRQAVVLRDETWRRDVDDLLRTLEGKHDDMTSTRRRGRVIAVAAALAVLLIAIGAWRLTSSNGGGGGTTAGLIECNVPNAAEFMATGHAQGGAAWNNLVLDNHPTVVVSEKPTDSSPAGALVFAVKAAEWRQVEPRAWLVVLHTTMKNATSAAEYHEDFRYDSLVVAQRRFVPSCFSPQPEIVVPRTVGDALVGFTSRCRPGGYIQLILAEDQGRISVTNRSLEPSNC
jgi:hypothetical protein